MSGGLDADPEDCRKDDVPRLVQGPHLLVGVPGDQVTRSRLRDRDLPQRRVLSDHSQGSLEAVGLMSIHAPSVRPRARRRKGAGRGSVRSAGAGLELVREMGDGLDEFSDEKGAIADGPAESDGVA